MFKIAPHLAVIWSKLAGIVGVFPWNSGFCGASHKRPLVPMASHKRPLVPMASPNRIPHFIYKTLLKKDFVVCLSDFKPYVPQCTIKFAQLLPLLSNLRNCIQLVYKIVQIYTDYITIYYDNWKVLKHNALALTIPPLVIKMSYHAFVRFPPKLLLVC